MNHCIVKACGLLALLLLVSSPIKAQTHPCGAGPGPGEVQVGESPGGNGLAPTPMCDWTNGNQSQGPQRPPERWQDHWGALVSDDSQGKLGFATDKVNEASAWLAAEENCHSKGGLNCTRLISYRNECVAMVLGDKTYSFSAGTNETDSIRQATQKCMKSTTNCHVYYSACSLPARIQ